MPLRFEAWTRPGSSSFEKRFDIPVVMPGSAGVRELSGWSDESIMVPASYSRLPELVSATDGSFIRVYHRSTLIDEFDANRVSLTAGKPNTRTVSGPQRNGLVEGVGILPKDYPNHKAGAFDWKWGAENILPDLSLADLGSIREEWEVKLLGERYQLDLSSATAGTFTLNPDGIGSTAAIDYDAEASAIKSALEALAGIDDVSVVETDDQGTVPQAYWIVFETPKDLTTDMTLDQSGLTGSATLTKFNDGFDTSTDPTFTITVDGQTTNALAWDASANKVEGTATNNTGLQGLSNVSDVVVSGSGTFADPWVIVFYDPPDISLLSVTFSAGSHQATLSVDGALDPSPITKSKPVDAGAGSEEEHGDYDDPPIEVVTTPLDTDAEWTLKVNATARYAGSQIRLTVTPGQTYSTITVPVYAQTTGTYTLVLRETNGKRIKNTTPRDVLLTAGSYQDLTIDTVTIPDGENEIIVRAAVTDPDPAKIDTFFVSWQTATFLEGDPEATWTQINREFLEAAQARGAGTHLEIDATDSADSLGTALSTMSYSFFWGNDAHLGQALGEGKDKGFQWDVVPAEDALVITPASTTTHVIQIYKVDADEIENTTASPGGPTVTVGGKGVTEAQVVSRRIPYTTLIGLGTGNVSKEDSNAAAETALGRIERVRDVEHLGNETAVQDYLDAQFAEQALNLKAATATVLETASQIPGVDYGPGSKIWWQFPGILDKEARPVKRFSWTHGLTAQFRIEGSRILTGEAAVVSAVDMLLRKQGRRRDAKKAPSPTSLIGGGGASSGAYIYLVRDSTQSIGTAGEAVSWTGANETIPRFNFAAPSYPSSTVTIQEPGYYGISPYLEWDSFTGGGSVDVVRIRGGVETVVWEWTATDGQWGEGIAAPIPCRSGDQIRIDVDHGDASAQDLAYADLTLWLIDRIDDPEWELVFEADNWGVTHDGSSFWTTLGDQDDVDPALFERDADGTVLNSYDGYDTDPTNKRNRGIVYADSFLWGVGAEETVSKVDPSDGSVVSTFAAGGGAAHQGIGWNGTNLFVTESDNSVILEYNTAGTLQNTHSFPSGRTLRGLTWDGMSWWATLTGSKQIIRMDSSFNETHSLAGPTSDNRGCHYRNGFLYIMTSTGLYRRPV